MTAYNTSVNGGASEFVAQVNLLSQRCGPNARFVFAGFSQGAQAALYALRANGGLPVVQRSKIAAVLLLANPKFAGKQQGVKYQGVSNGSGILGHFAVPTWAASRTTQLCKSDDGICHRHVGVIRHAKYDRRFVQPATNSAARSTTVSAVPQCNGRVATHVGLAGADVIDGTPGDDVIVGLGGNDRVDGRSRDDLICGGDGRDILAGGPGNDILIGGPGSDGFNGGAGTDTCYIDSADTPITSCEHVILGNGVGYQDVDLSPSGGLPVNPFFRARRSSSFDGQRFIYGCGPYDAANLGFTCLRDMNTGVTRLPQDVPAGWVCQYETLPGEISLDGRYVSLNEFCADSGGSLHAIAFIYDTATGDFTSVCDPTTNGCSISAFAGGARYVFFRRWDERIGGQISNYFSVQRLDLRTGITTDLGASDGVADILDSSDDGHCIVVTRPEGDIALVNLVTGAELALGTPATGPFVSGDCSKVVVESAVIDVATGSADSISQSETLSDDGRYGVTRNEVGVYARTDFKTGDSLSLQAPQSVTDVWLSPNARYAFFAAGGHLYRSSPIGN